MARKSQPQPLMLPDNVNSGSDSQKPSYADSPKSPLSIKSPKSPKSPSIFRFPAKKTPPSPPQIGQSMQSTHASHNRSQLTQSVTLPALNQYTVKEENQDREKPTRSGFFSNYKATKSQKSLDHKTTGEKICRDAEHPAMSEKNSTKEPVIKISEVDKTITRRPVGGTARSDVLLTPVIDGNPSSDTNDGTGASNKKKPKPKPFSLLNRTRSVRGDEHSPIDSSPSNMQPQADLEKTHAHKESIKTAPLQQSGPDRSFRDMMASNIRQHSADRIPTKRDMPGNREPKDWQRQPTSLSSSLREGHGFLSNLKSSATKGAGVLGKGLFGKSGRSGSTIEREPLIDDEHYQFKVINKPLVEQTRITRISKRLETSKDKTEFWMPALPWRAIDYLNYKGTDVEGLYRVPGSGPQVKKWQRKFDEEHDIDLFEQEDLYDINIIGSMLKAWLRELPDELFPKSAQDRISKVVVQEGNETVPQILIDELSALPPFNYYLLFAITCHLSLLLAHSNKNKMGFRNLCICFQPCMRLDIYCFKLLVCNWRDCWKGCFTEELYTTKEYESFAKEARAFQPPNSARSTQSLRSIEGAASSTAVESHDERNVSSSDSSKSWSVSLNDQQKRSHTQSQNKVPLSQKHSSLSNSTIRTTLTVVSERTPPRRSGDMRPLSPIKPLSPIGLQLE
ncbi:hypothetical protein BJ878DRAFT_203689 [Calycina marina]|uniref:Rho-GAP domain-containing protein n=1 Tax=Calycina marina TaxID=1763456 RepID=A0A9P7YZ87_9HELO|nr:hypothetical protein BJ878DRAFT_203689 [Calycina marina]